VWGEELGTGAGWGVSPAGVGRRGRGNWAMTPGPTVLAIGRIGSAWDSNSNCFGVGLGWVGFGACVYLIPFPSRVFFFSDLMNDGENERGSFGTFVVVVDDLTVGFHPFLRLFLTEKGMPLPWSGEEYVQQVQPRRDDAAFQPLLFTTLYREMTMCTQNSNTR
jgi:hypothetical protein